MTRWRTEVLLDASPAFRDEWEREMARQGWVKVAPCDGRCRCGCHSVPEARYLADPNRYAEER